MSTLHKVKAYFGMAPMDDFEDEYYDDDDRGPARGYSSRRAERFDDEGYGSRHEGRLESRMEPRGYDDRHDRDYDEAPAYRGGYDEPRFDPRLRAPREFDRTPPRFGAMRGSTRGALAMDPRRMAELFEAEIGRAHV